MSRLTRDQAVARLLDGIDADLGTCGTIRDLLERQCQAAMRHRGTELTLLAEALTPELDAMEQRRQQRVQLVRDCKQATTRNGNLMAEQFTIMQRLLHGEDDTYAPR
jgi:flagella synthesis protein FlgN